MIQRLDIFLFENGYFESREKAKRMIMAGNVTINGTMKDKPGEKIKNIHSVDIKDRDLYVSRGGLKLEKAFNIFDFSVDEKVAMDIGASTGGFTDCMLQHNARRVYAIDVGYGQLAWGLRQDERVINLERKNFRHMDFNEIGEKIDRFTMDVSFISVTKLLDKIKTFLMEEGEGIILIKPQFEAGKELVGKNGIIKDVNIHKKVLQDTINTLYEKDFIIKGLDYSPIKGTKGNIEYICYISLGGHDNNNTNIEEKIEMVVNAANNQL